MVLEYQDMLRMKVLDVPFPKAAGSFSSPVLD